MKSLEQKAPFLFQVCGFIHSNHAFDEETILQAKKVIADTLGTAFSGVKTRAFQQALNKDIYELVNGNFPIWGTELKSTLSGAVFYNTLAVSSTDFDEGHRKAVGHPASLVVPLSLLLGQYLKKPFSEVLAAVIIGYEMGTRFSFARVPENISSYSTGRWGGIASAASAAYLLGLSIEQTVQALSNAAVLSPAMLGGSTDVSAGSMSKEGVAWAAQSGLQSALMAKNGFTGPYLFVDETDDYQKQVLVNNLEKEWLINSNYFKPYACCRWLHPAISAGIFIKENNLFSTEEIVKVKVDVFSRALNLISVTYPENMIQAQFHLPFTLASGLLFGEVLPAFFSDTFLNNKEIISLVNKVELQANEQYSTFFPARLASKVTLTLKDGKSFSKESFSAPWDADDHPTEDELFQKFVKQTGEENKDIWHRIMASDGNLLLKI